MAEALFRVGGVYRDTTGEPCLLQEHWHDPETGKLWGPKKGWGDLIPGELHKVGDEWLPITSQPRSPYFAEAVEEEDPLDAENVRRYFAAQGIPAFNVRVQRIDPNAAMIARDGPAKPKPYYEWRTVAPVSTAHKAISGLTVVAAVDHRLGARVVHGS